MTMDCFKATAPIVFLIALTLTPAVTSAQDVQPIDISSQDLASAIAELSDETGLSVMAPTEILEGKTSPSVRGPLKPMEALTALLAGSGLSMRTLDNTSAVVTEEPSTEFALEPIVVTARKIEEPVRQVPFGISVIGAEQIDRQDIRDARSFGRKVPGFNFVDIGSRLGNLPNIRGVGSFFPQASDDASVPVFIDGVPLAVRAQDLELFDIERIEVLKGPQSSIFGRNAQAGAINVTTAAPSDEPSFEIGGEVGNFDTFRTTALASGPMSDELTGRISAQFESRNGDARDVNLQEDIGDRDLINAAGKLVWDAAINSAVTLNLRYGDYEEGPVGGLLSDPDFPRTFYDQENIYKLQTKSAGLTIEHDFDDVSLTSVTGLLYYDSKLEADDTDGLVQSALTGLPPATFNDPNSDFRVIDDDDRQFTQEIRLNGELANGTEWIAGANFFRSDFEFDFRINAPAFGLDANINSEVRATSYAGFGEVTIPLADKLRGIVGLRYTREEREFTSTAQNVVTVPGTSIIVTNQDAGDDSFDLVTGRVGLSYDLSPTLSGFATIARGAKSGGFQLADLDLALSGAGVDEFDSAFTTTYEAGLRGSLFENTLDINVSVFFNDTKDEHIQVFDLSTFQFVTQNIDTETYGIEIESAVRLMEGMTLTGGIALLDTKIAESDDPTVEVGNGVPFAPEVAVSVGAEYSQPFSLFGVGGDIFGRAEYQYVGEREADPQNSVELESFDLVNFRAGWDSDDISVYAFVNNAFDETYAEFASSFGPSAVTGEPVLVGNRGEPRRFGVGLKLRF